MADLNDERKLCGLNLINCVRLLTEFGLGFKGDAIYRLESVGISYLHCRLGLHQKQVDQAYK